MVPHVVGGRMAVVRLVGWDSSGRPGVSCRSCSSHGCIRGKAQTLYDTLYRGPEKEREREVEGAPPSKERKIPLHYSSETHTAVSILNVTLCLGKTKSEYRNDVHGSKMNVLVSTTLRTRDTCYGRRGIRVVSTDAAAAHVRVPDSHRHN